MKRGLVVLFFGIFVLNFVFVSAQSSDLTHEELYEKYFCENSEGKEGGCRDMAVLNEEDAEKVREIINKRFVEPRVQLQAEIEGRYPDLYDEKARDFWVDCPDPYQPGLLPVSCGECEPDSKRIPYTLAKGYPEVIFEINTYDDCVITYECFAPDYRTANDPPATYELKPWSPVLIETETIYQPITGSWKLVTDRDGVPLKNGDVEYTSGCSEIYSTRCVQVKKAINEEEGISDDMTWRYYEARLNVIKAFRTFSSEETRRVAYEQQATLYCLEVL